MRQQKSSEIKICERKKREVYTFYENIKNSMLRPHEPYQL